MPYCRFDIEYEKGPGMLLIHLAALRQLARYIKAKIYFSIEDKKYDEAKRYVKIGLKLGDCLKDEPILVSQLVRIAIDEMIIKSILEVLNNPDIEFLEDEYKEILSLINNKKIDITDALNAEMVIMGNYCFEQNNIILLTSPMLTPYKKITIKRMRYILKPIFKNDYSFYLKNFLNIIETFKKPYYLKKGEKFEFEKKEFYENKMSIKYFGSLFLLPGISNTNILLSNYIARLDTFKIAIALKIYKTKYGEYPESIERVLPEILPSLPKDPFTGENYIYKRKENGFLIYSVGKNQKDDNGIYDTKKQFDDIGFETLI